MRLETLVAGSGAGVEVMVHGDTLSTLVGALAARRSGARVVHLESGLTSGRLLDPFPEELCRRLVFRMTDVAMCPNEEAASYMLRKHGRHATVVDTGGNTILDAVALTGASSGTDTPDEYVVASLHRFQNIYDRERLHHLAGILEEVSRYLVVCIVLHPATRKRLEATGLLARLQGNQRVRLLPRMGYKEFLVLAGGAACVLTDGGSNQEELAALGVPTIVMRAHTERPDGLGNNALMEADVPGGVVAFVASKQYQGLRHPAMRFENGSPSQRIVSALWPEPPGGR